MKRLFIFASLFGLAVLLWACPYKSTVGMDDNTDIPLKEDLLGTWHKPGYPKDSTEVKFMRWNTKTYGVTAKIQDEDGKYIPYRFYAWFSPVGSLQLVTFYDLDTKDYYFGETFLSRNSLSIKLLSSDITTQKFYTRADMRRFVEQLYSTSKVKYDSDLDLNNMTKSE